MMGYHHPPGADTPPEQTHPPPSPTPQTRPPWSRHPPKEADSSIRSTSPRYTSYWNAFLFNKHNVIRTIPVGCILSTAVAISWGGVSAPGGCLLLGGVCSWGVSTPGGCLLWGGVCSGGERLLGGGGSLLRRVSARRGGGGIPACTEADTPPPPPWTPVKT